jgi:hypothetical protein
MSISDTFNVLNGRRSFAANIDSEQTLPPVADVTRNDCSKVRGICRRRSDPYADGFVSPDLMAAVAGRGGTCSALLGDEKRPE